MQLFSSRLGRVLGVSAVSLSVGFVSLACSSSSDDTGNGQNQTGAGGGGSAQACADEKALTIQFGPMYSAFVPGGAHTFKVPARVAGISGATVVWTVSDPALAEHEPDPSNEGEMFTVLKDGTATIKAQAGTLCGSTTLTVTPFTEDQWKTGSDRYNNNNPLPAIDTSNIAALIASFQSGANPLESTTAPPACANCHDAASAGVSALFKGVTHTPLQTAGFSDTELKAVFQAGTLPEGAYYNDKIGIPKTVWQRYHKWTDLTDDQATGLVVYLRSLEPKPAGGCYDFTSVIPSGVTIPSGGFNANTCGGGTGGTGSTGAGGSTP